MLQGAEDHCLVGFGVWRRQNFVDEADGRLVQKAVGLAGRIVLDYTTRGIAGVPGYTGQTESRAIRN